MSDQETEESNAAKYRRLAKEMRDEAGRAHDELVRAQLLTIAQSYEKLAARVELITCRQSVRHDGNSNPTTTPKIIRVAE